MSHKINVNYSDITINKILIINYLYQNSDCFSVSAVIKKPYSQIPPAFNYNEKFQPFVTQYIYERRDWLADFLGHLKHQIMVVCRCCKESRKMLLQLPNIFLPIENELPEDICFYRNNKIWFASISHEKLAFMFEPADKDIQFLKKNNIPFSVEP